MPSLEARAECAQSFFNWMPKEVDIVVHNDPYPETFAVWDDLNVEWTISYADKAAIMFHAGTGAMTKAMAIFECCRQSEEARNQMIKEGAFFKNALLSMKTSVDPRLMAGYRRLGFDEQTEFKANARDCQDGSPSWTDVLDDKKAPKPDAPVEQDSDLEPVKGYPWLFHPDVHRDQDDYQKWLNKSSGKESHGKSAG